ncbi:hypothetical protein ACIO6U_11645 [Streptomyces sp. NPDC087422]|uniref:hypothetical protein n=1 Tax=Streptomyces sp. NPDC087422 TaxID=3365786 RepID=UPI00381FBADE
MPSMKTSRRREKQDKRRAYVDLTVGRTRLTVPRGTARRAVRTVKAGVTRVGACCIFLVLAHLISQR